MTTRLTCCGLVLFTILPFATSTAVAEPPTKAEKQEAKRDRIERARKGDRRVEDTRTVRFEFSNDVVFDSDNLFTNGWELQVHYRPAKTFQDARMPIPFAKGIAKPFLPIQATDRYFRGSLVIGQIMQTPNNLSATEVIMNDVPHFGFLGIANTWAAFNDRKFTGFQTLVGVAGEPSLAGDLQKYIHEIIGSEEPMGWDNQIDFEPVINFGYAWKRKFVKKKGFDATLNLGAALGNLFTVGDVSIETRFGWNMPAGFVYIPDPIGRSMAIDASLQPPKHRSTFYMSLVGRGSAFLRYMGVDGNTFNDDTHEVEWNRLNAQLIAGLHFQSRNFGLHMNFWFTTEVLDDDWANPEIDRQNNFGTIMLEFHSPRVRRPTASSDAP